MIRILKLFRGPDWWGLQKLFFQDTPAYFQLSNLCDQRVGRYFADLVAWVRWESPEKVFLRRKNGGDIPFFSPKVVSGGQTVWTFWNFLDRESSTFVAPKLR